MLFLLVEVIVETSVKIVDIAILGGGPVGLYAAYYAGLREASCLVLESLPALGGRLASSFPEKFVYDVPGFPKIIGRELADRLIEQASQFGATMLTGRTLQHLVRANDHFLLTTDHGILRARTVVIASGVGSSVPQRHSAPGADMFEGKGLEYIVSNLAFYAGKRVAVVGGGDSAVDWANELLARGAKVTLIHRTQKFRAHEANLKMFTNGGGEILTDTEVMAFEGDDALETLVLKNRVSGLERALSVDAALVMFGFRSEPPDFAAWGIKTDDDGDIVVNERMESSEPGVFAAGDVVTHRGKIKLMCTGFAEAAIAINFAKVLVDPDEEAQPIYSSTLMSAR